mmetsp:Transcript_20510/g.33243  ORF Transcript_20510/g.33243 Transcript_20510/m.33243 type:complete len:250 (+) Transcript_20510:257-1006(+)
MSARAPPRAAAAMATASEETDDELAREPASSSAATAVKTKRLYLIRHGRTEMNDYLSNYSYGDSFPDPGMYDTRLTSLGQKQATGLRTATALLDPPPQVLIASPLSRALMTAELAFEGTFDGPREVCALASERIYHASDVGAVPEVIAAKFPNWNIESLRETPIWWYNGGQDDPKAVVEEPTEVFDARMIALKAWIERRDETVIAIVAHWGVWYNLTGRQFENCELVECELSDLKIGAGDLADWDNTLP